MYLVGTFQPPSAYAGRRVTFDAEVFTIEGVGPVDVRMLPGFAAAGEFAWADDGARVWGEERARRTGAPYAPAAAAAAKTPAWMWGAAAGVVIAALLVAVALAWPRPTPVPPRNGPVVVATETVPPRGNDTSETIPPVVIPTEPTDTPPIVVPDNPGPAPHARTLPGTWKVTSGPNKGTSYKFNKDGRVWWTTKSDQWEMEWWTSGSTLTLRRETLYFTYTYKISSDGWTMNWTAQDGSGTSVLERQ